MSIFFSAPLVELISARHAAEFYFITTILHRQALFYRFIFPVLDFASTIGFGSPLPVTRSGTPLNINE
jgi:hypothetical protein